AGRERPRGQIRATGWSTPPPASPPPAGLEPRRLATLDPEGDGAAEARARLEAAMQAVASTDPWLESAPEGVPDLQARLAEHEQDMTEAAAHLRRLDHVMERARERVIMAREELAEAEIAARPALLTREQEARLELLSFPSADESRKGKWRKTLRPEEQEEKDELLAVVGVDSWTAYTVYRTSPTVPPAKEAALAAARTTLADAEQHLSEMQARSEQDPVRLRLMAEEEVLRDEARAFLGMMLPRDLAPALAELVVRTANPEWEPTVEGLARALAGFGVTIDDPTDPVALQTEAVAVLAHDGDSFDARHELLADHEQATSAFDGHRRAVDRLEQAEAAATQATLGLARLEEQLMACGVSDAGGVDAVLTMIEPIATQVALEGNGSLPVILHGDLPVSAEAEAERLMTRLSALSAQIQIIVVSSRSSVTAWANAVGLDKAMISGTNARSVALTP
ncbi:MAG: hypothetical protein AAFN30_14540, partial [Actinomycetota bacterium]